MMIDGHCDVLMKLYEKNTSFHDRGVLDVTLDRLRQADCRMQAFAMFFAMKEPTMAHAAAYVRIFHERILNHGEMLFVRTRHDLRRAVETHRIGALLTLEGADVMQGNLDHLDTLYEMGVRVLGLTWNHANWAADGVLEPRQAPLSLKGRALVDRCNERGIILDVSHLAEPAFWELCERTARPPIASHANAHACCPHPRNLKDAQIRALIGAGGLMGITFVPQFVRQDGAARPDDLLRHIEHIATLGGAQLLALGSDFDGIDSHVSGLEHPGRLNEFKEYLLRYYSAEFVEGLYWRNAYSFYMNHLPEEQGTIDLSKSLT
jgi:membrane dipeptidase